jgi:PAS domain S-box-containing protein
MCIINNKGIVEFVNNKIEIVLGYTLKDISDIDTWFKKAYPDETYRNQVIAEWTLRINEAITGDNEIAGKEYFVTCKDGTTKNVYISGSTIMGRVVVMFIDMTSYRQMEKALYESEQHYKMISELTTDYVFRLLVDDKGKITMNFVSDNYGSITGRSKQDSGLDFWNNFIHPEDMPLLMRELKMILEKPQSSEFICRSFINGNKIRWVQVFSHSEWDPKEHRITSIVGAVKDITERKQAEEEIIEKNKAIEATNKEYLRLNEELRSTNFKLKEAKEKAEESNRLKTSFLQNMSHEIRTPMNAIMGFASLLPDNYNNKSKLDKFSRIIYDRCNDLLEIINDILDVSKIESGQMTTNIEAFDIHELFAELSQFFKEHQKRLQKEHIKFTMQVGEKIAGRKIMSDQVKLRQILINLIGNAFKFTFEGSVKCGCDINEKNEFVFYVSDTGIGIPQNKHELIFERFVQLEEAYMKSHGGTGLGLPIVKGLINILGGRIWLESSVSDNIKGIPGGSTFYFSLPASGIENIRNEYPLP